MSRCPVPYPLTPTSLARPVRIPSMRMALLLLAGTLLILWCSGILRPEALRSQQLGSSLTFEGRHSIPLPSTGELTFGPGIVCKGNANNSDIYCECETQP